jgi:hypothetical protein
MIEKRCWPTTKGTSWTGTEQTHANDRLAEFVNARYSSRAAGPAVFRKTLPVEAESISASGRLNRDEPVRRIPQSHRARALARIGRGPSKRDGSGTKSRKYLKTLRAGIREGWNTASCCIQLTLRDVRFRYKQAVMGFGGASYASLVVGAGC